jgi:hypothetical protein
MRKSEGNFVLALTIAERYDKRTLTCKQKRRQRRYRCWPLHV